MSFPTISARELRDKGYLQEANRQFFHPLGLALRVTLHDDPSQDTIDILDGRDDPQGWVFDVQPGELRDKAELIDAEWFVRSRARLTTLGYMRQPVEP